jgi:AraC-like DNA-binding protein
VSSWDAPRSPASALLLTRLADERGLPADTALAGTGLDLGALLAPGGEVTGRQELTVIRNLLRHCGAAPDLALQAGSRYHLTTYGIWGFALASSRTVRDALAVGARFVDLSFTFCEVQIEESEGELRVCLDDAALPEDVRTFIVTRDLAGLRTILTELVSSGLPLRSLSLRQPAPADERPYTELFGVAPSFSASRNVAVLDAALLDLPLPQADELTAAITEAQCRQVLEGRRARTGVAGQVRDTLVRSPAHMPDIGAVARQLAVSERTLRRRLLAEGTSFRSLADEVRETLAEELLTTGSLSVEEVGRRLGYAEPASFTHAFSRWKGMSPRIFTTRARQQVR